MEETGNIVIYESEGGDVRLDVRLENGNVWLTQQQMSLLYGKAPSTINEHIGDIFDDKELFPEACRKKFGNSEFQQNVELVLLSNLVADYEDEHYPIKKPTLIEVLKLRMFEMGLSQSSLAAMLGMNQSKISEIISGKSEPTLKQARKISQTLNISPAIVLGV
jgi:HTH-type transcriptional regulator/antitoxin HigA